MRGAGSVRIAPSLLAADFGRLADEIADVEAAGADLLHVDVMDGHFVPNLSIGVPVVKSVSKCTNLLLDVHLMIEEPGRYAPAFVEAGAGSITFHIETTDKPAELVRQIRDLGVEVGVSLNPGTSTDAIAAIVDQVDLVLVMTIWPGFGGQKFMPECLAHIRDVVARLGPHQWLQVDGGINEQTVPQVVEAGANNLVAGTAIFGCPDRADAIARLRRAAAQTTGARR